MTARRVASPTVENIKRHAELDHGYGSDYIARTSPGALLYSHERDHARFTTFKTAHGHYKQATSADLAALDSSRLAGLLDALPLAGFEADVVAEAASRLRAAPGEAPMD